MSLPRERGERPQSRDENRAGKQADKPLSDDFPETPLASVLRAAKHGLTLNPNSVSTVLESSQSSSQSVSARLSAESKRSEISATERHAPAVVAALAMGSARNRNGSARGVPSRLLHQDSGISIASKDNPDDSSHGGRPTIAGRNNMDTSEMTVSGKSQESSTSIPSSSSSTSSSLSLRQQTGLLRRPRRFEALLAKGTNLSAASVEVLSALSAKVGTGNAHSTVSPKGMPVNSYVNEQIIAELKDQPKPHGVRDLSSSSPSTPSSSTLPSPPQTQMIEPHYISKASPSAPPAAPIPSTLPPPNSARPATARSRAPQGTTCVLTIPYISTIYSKVGSCYFCPYYHLHYYISVEFCLFLRTTYSFG